MTVPKATTPRGEQVKTLRTTLGWTQEKLAAEAGVSFSTVNRWENNHSQPSGLAVSQLKVIARKHLGKQAKQMWPLKG